MSRVALTAAALLVFVRCIAGTDVGKREYACTGDGDCADGFVCGRASQVCEPVSSGTGGGQAGGAAAGGAQAGGGVSGGGEAGGGTSGGGATAGGAAGGGATAGGGGTAG